MVWYDDMSSPSSHVRPASHGLFQQTPSGTDPYRHHLPPLHHPLNHPIHGGNRHNLHSAPPQIHDIKPVDLACLDSSSSDGPRTVLDVDDAASAHLYADAAVDFSSIAECVSALLPDEEGNGSSEDNNPEEMMFFKQAPHKKSSPLALPEPGKHLNTSQNI